jgi:hypothetical protein
MSKMNYNRPNGGYETEVWKKELPSAVPISKLQRKAYAMAKQLARQKQKQINNPIPPEIKHDKHKQSVRMSISGKYAVWCEDCRCRLIDLTDEEYKIYKELFPPVVRKVSK